MDCFEVLGINETKDLKEIKRAYSHMLLIHSPEFDPEGFQRVREAYEQALAKAKGEEIPAEKLSPVDEFMARFKETYDCFEKRINPACWKELLDSDICCNIETGKEVSEKILAFMMDGYNFPYEIWNLFNDYFSWTSKKEKLYLQFPKNFIDFVIYKITNKTHFRYEYVKECTPGKEEFFLTEYSRANNALEEYDLYNAKKAIENAKEVCPNHPDLLLLTSRYLNTNGQLDEGMALLNSVIEKYGEDLFAYYYRANLFFRLGKFNQAYEDYKKGLSIKSDFIDILFSIGKCAMSLNKYEEAAEYFEKLTELIQYNRDARVLLNSAYGFRIDELKALIEQSPEDIDLKYKLAKAYYSCRMIDESLEVLNELEQNGKMNSDLYVLMCKVLFDSDKKELAYATVTKAYELYPDNYDVVFYKACILDEFNKYEEALEYYDKAIAINSKDAVAHSNKAYAYNMLKRYPEALECANQAIAVDPYIAHGYKNKAEALLGLELYQECLEACEEGLSIYFYLTDIYIIKMRLYTRVGQFDEALNVFNKAIDNGIKDSRLYYHKANILRLMQKYEDSIVCCDQAIELDEARKESYYCKGLCFFAMDKYKEAAECFDAAIQKDAVYSSAYYYRILCMLNTSRNDEALRELDKAIGMGLENTDRFHELKGDVLAFKNKYDDAVWEYKKAVQINPSVASYHYSVGYNLSNSSKFDEALKHLDKAIELDSGNANFYICKSHCFYSLGRFNECIGECEKALQIEAEYIPALRNKAWACYKLSKIDDAERLCQTALKLDGNNVNLLYLKLNILRHKGLNQDALVVCDRIKELDPEDQEIVEIHKELLEALKPKKGLLGSIFGK